jgi:N-acetylmuramoyl-L-alanine amidase
MKKRKYIIIHCTATPEGRNVTAQDIVKWHTAPKPQGNGWKQVGYADFIELNGTHINLVDNNYDAFVDSWEITNGVKGYNDVSLHICYAGGCDTSMQAKDTLTEKQETTLVRLLKRYIALWSDVKIGGHNQFAAKACPSFDTVEFCLKHKFPAKNIHDPQNKIPGLLKEMQAKPNMQNKERKL